MEQMDRMTMGWWRPSPGSIYPLLEQLEQEKLITKDPEGRYHLTDEARDGPGWMREFGFFGEGSPRDPEEALRQLESYVRFLEDVGRTKSTAIPKLRDRLKSVSQRIERLSEVQ